MKILTKIKSWFRENISEEDPKEKTRSQLEKLRENTNELAVATAKVTAERKTLEAKYQYALEQSELWKSRAKSALEKGNETLSKEALSRKLDFDKDASSILTNLNSIRELEKVSNRNLKSAKRKLSDSERNFRTLSVNNQTAKIQSQLNEILSRIEEIDMTELEEENIIFECLAETPDQQLESKFEDSEREELLEKMFQELKVELE